MSEGQSPGKVLGPVDLPSGRKVTFRIPNGADRRATLDLLIQTRGANVGADRLLTEQALAMPAVALVTVDGAPVDPDFRYRQDRWDNRDIVYYSTVYNQVVGLDEQELDKAAAVAKSLRGAG